MEVNGAGSTTPNPNAGAGPVGDPVDLEGMDVEQLRELVRQLGMRGDQSPAQVTGGEEQSGPDPILEQRQTDRHAHVVTRYVHMIRERKCPPFSGNLREDTLSIEAWIEEVNRCWEGRDLTPAEKVVFIQDHLTGNAKEEVDFQPVYCRDTPTKIFALLREHFRCPQSYVTALAQFCQRHQKVGETVREYSYALKRLMEVANSKIPGGVPDADRLMRDQLVEHVRDGALRRHLDQRVEAVPLLAFRDVRAVAVRWEESRALAGGRGESPSGAAALARSEVSACSQAAAAEEMAEPTLRQLYMGQQKQLEALTKTVAELVGCLKQGGLPQGPAQRMNPRPSGDSGSRLTCFRCGLVGHIARYCSSEVPPVASTPSAPQPSGGGPPQGAPVPVRAVGVDAAPLEEAEN